MSFEASFENDFRNPKQLRLDESDLSALEKSKRSKGKSRNNLQLNLDNSSSFESPLKNMKKSNTPQGISIFLKFFKGIVGGLELPPIGDTPNQKYFEVDASNIRKREEDEEEELEGEEEEGYSDEENDDVKSLFPASKTII